MYDMYPWNDPGSGANHHQDEPVAARLPAPRTSPREAAAKPGEAADPAGSAIRAVQVALDRRDNGGRDNGGRDNGGRDKAQTRWPRPASPRPGPQQPGPASKVLAWIHEPSGWPSSAATGSVPR